MIKADICVIYGARNNECMDSMTISMHFDDKLSDLYPQLIYINYIDRLKYNNISKMSNYVKL